MLEFHSTKYSLLTVDTPLEMLHQANARSIMLELPGSRLLMSTMRVRLEVLPSINVSRLSQPSKLSAHWLLDLRKCLEVHLEHRGVIDQLPLKTIG